MTTGEQLRESRITQEAADWHARLRSESITEVEEARFRAWLSGDPARRREFDQISAMWDAIEGVGQSPEVLAARQALNQPLNQSLNQPSNQKAPSRHVNRRAVVGWALAAGVASAAGFIGWRELFASETYITGIGEQRTVPLSDGSIITLNTASEVSVRLSERARRIELVRGEAHFEVAKDVSRPFVVRAGQGEVLALGTAFDVYKRRDGVVVTLAEGRVAVIPQGMADEKAPNAMANSLDNSLALEPGDQVVYGTPGLAPVRTKVDLQRVLAWRSRKLIFVDTLLAEAITEANRYSRLQVELRAPELASARISGTFEAGRNDAFAEGVQAFFGLAATRTGDERIVLTPQRR